VKQLDGCTEGSGDRVVELIAFLVENRCSHMIVVGIGVLLVLESVSGFTVDILRVRIVGAHDGVNAFKARGSDLYSRSFAHGVNCWLYFGKASAVGVVFAHTRIDGMARPTTAGANGRRITRACIGTCSVLSSGLALVTVIPSVAMVTTVTVATDSAVTLLTTVLAERLAITLVVTVVALHAMIALEAVVAAIVAAIVVTAIVALT
jgi:hypothetical protein